MNSTTTNTNTRLKILIVDDENSIQRILKHYFKGKYDVHTCSNGREGLSWLYENNLPDFIIADVNMPVLNGFDFIDEIRTSGFFRNIPLVILSGIDDSDTKIRCLEAGADDFLIKPFNPRELEARLNSVLRRVKIYEAA
jgi:DNA-binding response OmpR family regulator